MSPAECVIVERCILDSEVTARIPETLTLKPLERSSAFSDIRKVHDGVGVILDISGAVNRHLRGAKFSKDGLQTFAIVDNRHLLVDGATSFIPDDGIVEVENQNTRGLRFTVSVRDIRFLASIPMRAASDIRWIQARLVQALVLRIDKMVVCCIQTS